MTLSFTTLLYGGLETLQKDEQYTVTFEGEEYDIVSFKKTMNGNLYFINFSCEHISYRLNNYERDNFGLSGSASEFLILLLRDTEFTPGTVHSIDKVTYVTNKTMNARAILFDYCKQFNCDVIFTGRTVSLTAHRGTTVSANIINRNVVEISKTVNIAEESEAYTLSVRENTPIAVGDEVHLLFTKLGIDDYVRVVGIKRQPFISKNITLEVGGYAPSLESESAQIATDMVSTKSTYYGAKISADNGIEVARGDGDAKVVFNADKMAFYQGGTEVLFFDPVARKWKMSASAEVYVSDSEGNETTIKALADGLTTRIEDADNHYIEIKQTLDGLTVTTEDGQTLIDGGMIVTDNIQLHRLIAKESPNSFIEMMTNGLNFVLGNANTIGIGYSSADIPLPYIIFGEGASPQSDASGMIKFYNDGLWVGDSADRHSETIQFGTGLFVDIAGNRVYIYIDGQKTEVVDSSNLERLVNEKIEEYNPVAVFG